MENENSIKLAEFLSVDKIARFDFVGDIDTFKKKLDNPIIEYFTYKPSYKVDNKDKEEFVKVCYQRF